MRKTYFSTFNLGVAGGKVPPLSEVFSKCYEWAQAPRPGIDKPFPKLDDLTHGGSFALGPSSTLAYQRHEEPEVQFAGFRLDHPDAEDAMACWRTEVCLADDRQSGILKLAISTLVGRADGGFAPLHTQPSRPRLVRDLLGQYQAHDVYSITPFPTTVIKKNTDRMIEAILNPKRALPVLFCSASSFNDKPILDDLRLVADRLAGLAHVYVAEGRWPSMDLTERFGSPLSCWGGAMRVYWPGFTLSSQPFEHPLILPHRIQLLEATRKGSVADDLLLHISRVSINRVPSALVQWEEVGRRLESLRRKQLKDAGDDRELLNEYTKDNDAMRAEIERLKNELSEARSEAEKARQEAKAWRETAAELQKSDRNTGIVKEAIEMGPPESVEEAVERIKKDFPEQIAFPLNAQSEVKKNPFDEPLSVYNGLRFLATFYREAKCGKRKCADFDQPCREASGLWYRPHQSKVTMGMFSNFYETKWNGRTVRLEEHLGKGESKDPRQTIRIAFWFDETEKVVVVGFIGQHQKTEKT